MGFNKSQHWPRGAKMKRRNGRTEGRLDRLTNNGASWYLKIVQVEKNHAEKGRGKSEDYATESNHR